MNKWLACVGLLLLLAGGPVSAEVLVLVHGYLGTANSWTESGVMHRLQRRGYHPVGRFGFSERGVTYSGPGPSTAERPVYAVDLPSLAPVVIQADWLAAQLREVRKRHPEAPINVAAHSAGGIVARMALVRHPDLKIQHLITIAAPHFGTDRAVQALSATETRGMFGFVRSWMVRRAAGDALYATAQSSRGLLFDLIPPAPGNLLFWLNQQPHPEIRYSSIMRIGSFAMPGDQVVPSFSQDLNRVPALAGKVQSYVMAEGHLLTTQDGDLIANLLAMPRP